MGEPLRTRKYRQKPALVGCCLGESSLQHPKRKGGQGGPFNTSSESTFESKHAILMYVELH